MLIRRENLTLYLFGLIGQQPVAQFLGVNGNIYELSRQSSFPAIAKQPATQYYCFIHGNMIVYAVSRLSSHAAIVRTLFPQFNHPSQTEALGYGE